MVERDWSSDVCSSDQIGRAHAVTFNHLVCRLLLDKYLRISEADYLQIKRWHSLYNEFGMASTVRDIILFFYNGVVKYGLEGFLEIVGKKLKIDKLKNDFLSKMTQLLNIAAQKQLLYALVIENYPKYVYST